MIIIKILPFVALILTPILADFFEECSDVPLNSFIPAAEDCRSFIHCSDEQSSFKYTCPDGAYFDEDSGKCEFDFDNICLSARDNSEQSAEVGQEDSMEETTLSNFVPVSTTSPFLTTIYEHLNHITTRPKCDRYSNAFYPHLKRCEYYYKCVGGYLTILRCNFYHAWDYEKELCAPYKFVHCIDGSQLSTYV